VTQLLLLAAVVIWGWTFVATKICLESMSPIQLVASRFLIAVPSLFLVARLRGATFRVGPHKRSLLLGVLIFSAHYLLQTWALEFTTATNSGWIVTVTPLAIAILAAAFLGESISTRMVLGILVASTGIGLLVSRGEVTNLSWLSSVGDWMVLGSTFTWAAFTIVTRDPSRSLDPSIVALTMTLPLAAAALALPFSLGSYTSPGSWSGGTWGALIFLGVFGVALAQWFWQAGIARLGAAQAGLFLYLEPLATTALAVPYLGEPFPLSSAVGGGLVVLGVFLARRKRS
jgi:drug/metabolite transporter (DMT)-like permease